MILAKNNLICLQTELDREVNELSFSVRSTDSIYQTNIISRLFKIKVIIMLVNKNHPGFDYGVVDRRT